MLARLDPRCLRTFASLDNPFLTLSVEPFEMAPPSGPTTLCLACFSSVLASSSSSSRPPFKTPCCSRPICERCLDAKPRLAAYCLHCQNPIDVVSAPVRAAEKRIGATEKWMGERAAEEEAHNFVIGDDDGVDEGNDDEKMARSSSPSMGGTEDMTPDYQAALQEMAPHIPGDDPPAYDFPHLAPAGKADPNDEKADGKRPTREGGLAIHYLRYPHDTLAGLALKYKVDVRPLQYHGGRGPD